MWRWEALVVPMKMKSEHIVVYIQSTFDGLMPPTTTADTDNLGEGDSHLVLDLLPEDEDWMEKLKQEVQFKVMLHRGLMVIFGFESIFCDAYSRWDL